MLSKEELDNIGENDINNYFQMSVEMFDYMDEILALQAASKYCNCYVPKYIPIIICQILKFCKMYR